MASQSYATRKEKLNKPIPAAKIPCHAVYQTVPQARKLGSGANGGSKHHEIKILFDVLRQQQFGYIRQ